MDDNDSRSTGAAAACRDAGTSAGGASDHVPMVRVRHAYKRFGTVEALADINLDVFRGEVVAILGPSGSGKSTLCRCINRLEHIDEGAIHIEGTEIPREGRELAVLRANIGMVFQSFNLFPQMTVLENIILGPVRVRGQTRAEATEAALRLLVKTGIERFANALPANLSGGQQQRAAIARALAMSPRMMLFDEPTSALDPELVQGILDIMKELAAEGMTMILVTHEVLFAREVADRIVFMVDGRIVEEGTPEQFFTNPKTDRARLFLSQIMSYPAGGT